MAADDVFPAEMPDTPFDPIAPSDGATVAFDGVVLDGDTAERLLGRPPRPRRRASGLRRGGQGAAGRRRPALPGRAGRPAGRPGHVPQAPPPRQGPLPPGHRGPRRDPDHRGVVDRRWSPRLPSGYCPPPGGPAPAGRGQARPRASRRGRVRRGGRGGSGPALRAALPPVGSRTGASGGGGSPRLPSTRERAIAGHGGGGPSRAGGSAGGLRPAPPAKGQAAKPPKPSKAKPGKAKPGKAKPGKAEKAGTAGQGGGRRK